MEHKWIIAVSAAAFLSPVLALDAERKEKVGVTAATREPSMSEGEVRRVDKEGRKITIRHGRLANLDMPPMTMVFQVRDPALLERVKPGDRIRFVAEKADGAFVATTIEPLR